MKKLYNLVKYQLQIYFRGSGFIMPLIVTVIFLYAMYSMNPVEVVSSFLVTGIFLFFLMVWIGLSVSSCEDSITEQILLLRVENAGSYYASKVVVLICLSLLVNLLCTLFPAVQNLINGCALFSRPLTFSDLGNAFLLQSGCAFAGAAIGSLLHPRVMKDRKLALVLTVLLSTFSILRTILTEQIPMLKTVLWILPPVALPAKFYGNAQYFSLPLTLKLLALLCIYGIVLSTVKSLLCHRNKF